MSASKKAAKKPVAKTAAVKPKAKPAVAKKAAAASAARKPVTKVKQAASPKAAAGSKTASGKKAPAGGKASKPVKADSKPAAGKPPAAKATGKAAAKPGSAKATAKGKTVSKATASATKPKTTAQKPAVGKADGKNKQAAKKSGAKATSPAKPGQAKAAAAKSGGKAASPKKNADKKAATPKPAAKPATSPTAPKPKPAAGKAISGKAAKPVTGKVTPAGKVADGGKSASGKAAVKQPQSVGKGKPVPASKQPPKASAAEHGTQSAVTAKPAAPRQTAPNEAAPTKPATKKARSHFVKQSSSSKQDNSQTSPELDAKTKELVLSARKRTANGSAQKPGRGGKGAIAFTMDDVAQVLARKQSEAAPQTAGEKTVPATAAKVARKQEVELEIPQEKRVHSAVSLSDILGFNPAEKKTTGVIAATSKGREVPRKWSRYFKQLIELREQVSNVLEQHTAETLKRSNRDDSGDLSGYGQHMADAGTDTFDRDFALSMVSSEQEALFEINEAIERIYNGSYGVCEITGETISAERLEAVPFTRYSLEGQKELEKTKRQKIQRGGVFTDNEDNLSFDEDDN